MELLLCFVAWEVAVLHRIRLSHAFLLTALVSCGGAGYDPNDLTTTVDGSTIDDGGTVVVTESGTMTNTPPTAYNDPFANAPPFTPKTGQNGKHNEGQDCCKSGCHGGSNPDGPAFVIGGTVYADYAGKTPLAGVEIRVVDANGKATSTYSATGGNFYISGKSGSIAFPAVVGARNSSSTRPMITTLSSAAMGGCASGGCHGNGIDPIHVP